MKLFKDVRITLFHLAGDFGLGFTIHYTPEGKLIKIVNPYDNTILHSESKSVKRKRSIRKADEAGS